MIEEHTIDWIKKNQKDLYIVTGTIFEDYNNPSLKCDVASGDFVGPEGDVLWSGGENGES
jgi:hypothetical protein